MPANKSNRIRLENSSEINEKLQTVEIGGEASPVGISKNAVKLQSNKSFVIGNSVQLIDNNRIKELMNVLEETEGKAIIWANYQKDIVTIMDSINT